MITFFFIAFRRHDVGVESWDEGRGGEVQESFKNKKFIIKEYFSHFKRVRVKIIIEFRENYLEFLCFIKCHFC